MGDISLSAEKRAEVIINNANANAEAIQREARESISKLTEETLEGICLKTSSNTLTLKQKNIAK